MGSFVLALRAIGTNLAIRLYVPVVIAITALLILLLGGSLWLTALSSWWWLLLIPLVGLFCVVAAVASVFLLLIRAVKPTQTKAQNQAVGQFVDKLQTVIDVAGTPKILILFRVIRSIAAPSKSSYLSSLANSQTLARDFREVQQSFESDIVIK